MELHALFYGRVQGVGFRWSVAAHAKTYQITGTVQNLSDGSVEVYAQGSQEDLKSFLAAIQKDSAPASIESVKVKYKKLSTQYHNFKII